MARRKSRSSADRSAQREPRRALPPEERRAEAATVAWMLAAVATLAAQFVALAARVVAGSPTGEAPPIARILPGWFLICALFTGLVCIALTPVVYRMRRTPPPWPITVGAIAISLTPLVALWLMAR